MAPMTQSTQAPMTQSADQSMMQPMESPLTARQLRWLAEGADGHRDEEMVIAQTPDGLQLAPAMKASDEGWDTLLRVRTDHAPEEPGMRQPVEIWLVHGGKAMKLEPEVDAVFVTQSAVEKFVFPYYMKHWTLAEIAGLRAELFAKASVLAAPHITPSITKGFVAPSGREAGEIRPICITDAEWTPLPEPLRAPSEEPVPV